MKIRGVVTYVGGRRFVLNYQGVTWTARTPHGRDERKIIDFYKFSLPPEAPEWQNMEGGILPGRDETVAFLGWF